VPMVRLDTLGAIGPDRKRIHEDFKVSTEDWSPYPGFWGHDSTTVRTISQKPYVGPRGDSSHTRSLETRQRPRWRNTRAARMA
jgi:hypothetical protein